MCWEAQLDLTSEKSAAGVARRFCASQLRLALGRDEAAQDCVNDAVLVTSELVANAVNAGCRAAVVRIDVHREHVRIAVEDDVTGVERPKMQRPSSRDAHGRGLQIVDRLAREWGVTLTESGKRVWAELDVPRQWTVNLRCVLPTATT
jgi:anti-sigma regulatory factor (Ser/Thr protein kinase)